MKTIPLDFIHGDHYNDCNPYNVRDGKWGGFGEQSWYIFPEVHTKNVWEIKRRYDNAGKCTYYDWDRVWDNDKKIWRIITDEELLKIPKLEPRLHHKTNIDDFTKIIMPIIKKCKPDSILTELISVQPMSQPMTEIKYEDRS